MSRLYPRLLPGAASRRFKDLQVMGPQPPKEGEEPSLADAVFAATGGTRVTGPDLTKVRFDLVERASASGFPTQRSRTGYAEFDVSVARYLHGACGMVPGEAAQRSVWSYFGLVLVPDICAWRYPANETRGFLDDRFVGADLTRHTLGRLWLRAHLLFDDGVGDPYGLIVALGEADMDQILARRLDVAASPALVREIVRAHRDDPRAGSGPKDRDVLRDSLKRLLRLAAFLDLDSLSRHQLASLVHEARDSSRRTLESR
ncbi:DUF6339 family protein [Kineosporia sp. R_H_3]|uniref:DUF6339 family protein n=1 Tax=Kineosporia sp. R_H_3 TaxID=1961848 RepID=UPI000B4B4084|nr:DUF6339 family protein [Kineosporia sp. R_H_3]